MITIRKAMLGLLLGVVVLGACSSSRQAGPAQSGPTRPARTSSNVVTREQIENLPSVRTVEDVLIQLVPGIERSGSGLRIRGLQGAPLIVINNVPTGGTEIPVSPRDVARIEVLRTGGEIAAYGFRGSGGVILISTGR